ncbi:hypothetical protein METUNv1_03555 [Methyloversatilis universalis FAM5]|uniref:Uncharacterized protein n=1 Tax=Methyloversatilis universalis (strain ATCC BAA-1314 / DSM 25237 / JCM 13912 / CCUG 52030 / FAM5) TaxID=1000565 RepID=F5RGW4_METUF|nr:hypothetical protein [Methyloversatilis universalis]EGK70168.1 hypothetical protein METUNv1_03555 [Methyloversatilis universalis FAM5]
MKIRIKCWASAMGLSLLAAGSVHAATLTCTGLVSAVTAHADGSVWIKAAWNNNPVQVCNTVTAWKSVPTEACKRWHAAALLARTTQQTLQVYYGSTAVASCAGMGSYGAADAPTTLTNQ